MACPETCSFNEIRQPLTTEECETLTSGVGIDGITDVCDYLQSLPARLFSIQQYLQDAGNYGALPVNEESKCKPGDAPTASSLTSEIARAINGIVCYLCGVSGNVTHFHSEPGDFNQSATEPVNTPDPLKAGDTVIEDFDDYIVFWTYDGVNWVKNFTHDKSDANTTFETYNQTIPTPSYTTPQTTPADPEAGDTLVEQFLDGIVYWTYDGTNWVKNFTDSKDIHSYHVLQAGNAPSLTPIFPVPITTAQAGDTAIVRWDNGEAKYTYNGASWVLDWFTQDTAIPAIPFITDNGDETYTYDDGDGNTFVIDTNDTVTTLVDNGDGTYTYTNEDGDVATIDVKLSTIVDNGDGTYTITDDFGNSATVNTNDTVTTMVDNGDGTYTYTNEEGTQTIIDANDIVTEVNNTITGHKIADYTNEDGTVVDINETITSITDNSDGTFTYTDENGDIFDIDTNRTDHHNILQTGDAPSATPPFPTAITGAIAGDTAIVKWDNGEAKYTFDGTNWVLDWFEENASNAPVAVEDTNGNITVLNGNGNIPLATTGNVGYVSGGELVIPGALEEYDIAYTTLYTANTAPNAYGNSPDLVSQVITNNSGEDRLYIATLEGGAAANLPTTKAQVGFNLKATGVSTKTSAVGAFGNGASNVDNFGTVTSMFSIPAGSSKTVSASYIWQNTQGTSWVFDGFKLRLTIISIPME